jgi:hypothetical protein
MGIQALGFKMNISLVVNGMKLFRLNIRMQMQLKKFAKIMTKMSYINTDKM